MPQRTCVGCRETASRSVLMRIVVSELGGVATAEVDLRRRRPGRGCWLHPSPDCLDLALRRRAFARALRLQSPLGTEGLAASIAALAGSGDPRSRPSRAETTYSTGSGKQR